VAEPDVGISGSVENCSLFPDFGHFDGGVGLVDACYVHPEEAGVLRPDVGDNPLEGRDGEM